MLVLGELAIKNGLSQSLLERLYTVYNDERLTDASSVHSATLLTNFRCHHAILSLPSYLFYDSALITAAEAVTHLHPQAKYPLHFICSELSEAKEVHTNTNQFEVTLLLQEISKYINVKSWPNQWGEMDLSKICVMTTTAHQASQNSIFCKFILNFRNPVLLRPYFKIHILKILMFELFLIFKVLPILLNRITISNYFLCI